jgi:protein involved in polysaccharide export with SLBB domain
MACRDKVVIIVSGAILLVHAGAGQVIRLPGQPSASKGASEKGQFLDRVGFLRIPKISTDYVLGPGDELKIEVVGQESLTSALQSVKISNSGQITIPLAGVVRAADLTASQLEAAISSRLKAQHLLKDPEVLVFISDYQAKPIYILGEVDNPGEYIMTQQLTLMEAILMAGGIDYTADRFGYLHRRISRETARQHPGGVLLSPETALPGTEVIKVDLEPLKNGGVLQPDIPLRAGDVFAIPKRPIRQFYAIGDFKGPGSYEIPAPAERELRISQAIAQAGGPNQTAKLSRGMLVRYDEHGKRVERKVDFAAIIKGKSQDFPVRPNDIIFLPGSTIKTLEYGLLGALPGVAQVNAQTRIQNAR